MGFFLIYFKVLTSSSTVSKKTFPLPRRHEKRNITKVMIKKINLKLHFQLIVNEVILSLFQKIVLL